MTRRTLFQRLLTAAAGCVLAKTPLVGPRVDYVTVRLGSRVDETGRLIISIDGDERVVPTLTTAQAFTWQIMADPPLEPNYQTDWLKWSLEYMD